jgi:hypothetical protein
MEGLRIGCHIGITVQVGEREFFRADVDVQGIDPAASIEEQMALAGKAYGTVFDAESGMLLKKVQEYLATGGKKK